VQQALLVFRAALALAKETFAPIPIVLVYVPSPLAVYRLVTEEVPIDAYEGPYQVHRREEVARRTDEICAGVSAIAAAVGVDFLDARPAIRAAARDRPVHGPGDWKHLNRAGYEALGQAIAGALAGERGDGRCRALDPPATAAR